MHVLHAILKARLLHFFIIYAFLIQRRKDHSLLFPKSIDFEDENWSILGLHGYGSALVSRIWWIFFLLFDPTNIVPWRNHNTFPIHLVKWTYPMFSKSYRSLKQRTYNFFIIIFRNSFRFSKTKNQENTCSNQKLFSVFYFKNKKYDIFT